MCYNFAFAADICDAFIVVHHEQHHARFVVIFFDFGACLFQQLADFFASIALYFFELPGALLPGALVGRAGLGPAPARSAIKKETK